MSVEAVSWALNLAPVPVDAARKPNSACAFVLVGLANHAGPDGTAAFPSVDTLVRYTRLSERTVRTALDRLEQAGLLKPCAPEIIAARIRRADRRPQGWDLDLTRVRDDLDDRDIAALERQFPGLRDRILANQGSQGGYIAEASCAQSQTPVPVDNPVAETPVDNDIGGVQSLHPASGAGCSRRADGVQLTKQRGAAAAPELSIEPPGEPSAALARACDPPPVADGQGGGADSKFFSALGPGWLLSASQRARIASAAMSAVAEGWDASELAAFVGQNPSGARSPYAVLAARLSPTELPAPRNRPTPRRRPWCGHCDPNTRFLLDERGYPGDSPRRCPRCGPEPPRNDPA